MRRVLVERLTVRISGADPATARRLAVDVARRVAGIVRDVKTSRTRMTLNVPRKVR